MNTSPIEHDADLDAIAGVSQRDLAVKQRQGQKEEWNPIDHPEHAKVTETMNKRPLLADLAAQLELLHEFIAQAHEPASFLVVKVFIALLVEIIGSWILMTNAGFEVPVNILGAIALAVAIFALVSLTSRTRDYRWYAAIAALVIVSCAVASLRAHDAIGEEDGRTNGWALGVVALIMTIGPALWAEPLLKKLGMLFPHLRRRKRLSGQHAKLEQQIADAEAYRAQHKKTQLHWEDTEQRLNAAYDVAYERKRAEIKATDPTR